MNCTVNKKKLINKKITKIWHSKTLFFQKPEILKHDFLKNEFVPTKKTPNILNSRYKRILNYIHSRKSLIKHK